jgi:hypothetical protein
MLNEIVSQAEAAARLLERAKQAADTVRALRSGDRVYTPLIASAEFQQGTAASANLVFNVPADADFWAYRFMLYPYCRVIDPTGATPSDVAYRPTSFTAQPNSPGIVDSTTLSDFETQMDAEFAFIFDGKEVQSTNIPAAATYCVNVEKWSALPIPGFNLPIWTAATQTPSGMLFDVPWFFPRGKTLTCRVTPTYLGVRTIDLESAPGRQNQYKLVGVLEGEKRPGAYR